MAFASASPNSPPASTSSRSSSWPPTTPPSSPGSSPRPPSRSPSDPDPGSHRQRLAGGPGPPVGERSPQGRCGPAGIHSPPNRSPPNRGTPNYSPPNPGSRNQHRGRGRRAGLPVGPGGGRGAAVRGSAAGRGVPGAADGGVGRRRQPG